ncbi:thioredoxin [Chlamydiifrater phoenicopteri]|uniref:thioredoxin n=1 Tax=Chlamydiifrater phoenicopteri TaxID=2681469 RepID=UPI001BCB3166|nr:thioredoxin [Chlamydiifrater phoenicopteri]
MVKVVSDDSFDAFVASNLVLVDFFAEWCGPCRMLTPIIEEIAKEIPGVSIGKVNIDESSKIAGSLGISSIPTLILFKDGKEVERVVGLKDKAYLIKLIEKHQ